MKKFKLWLSNMLLYLANAAYCDMETYYSNEFDIENINVYGVERVVNNRGISYTVIGYKDASGEDCEWSTYCDLAKHDEYVKRFQLKLSRPLYNLFDSDANYRIVKGDGEVIIMYSHLGKDFSVKIKCTEEQFTILSKAIRSIDD